MQRLELNKDPYEDKEPLGPPENADDLPPEAPARRRPVRGNQPALSHFLKPANANEMEKVFAMALKHGPHKTKDKTSQAKQAWILHDQRCYEGDDDGPGPLQAYERFVGAEYQNKVKGLTLNGAKHYDNRYKEKLEKFGFDFAPWDQVEISAHEILSQRDKAEKERKREANNSKVEKEVRKAERKAKAGKRKRGKDMRRLEKEAAEAYVGATPAGVGVHAPSGVDLSKSDEDALAGMNQQPRSRTGDYFVYCVFFIVYYLIVTCTVVCYSIFLRSQTVKIYTQDATMGTLQMKTRMPASLILQALNRSPRRRGLISIIRPTQLSRAGRIWRPRTPFWRAARLRL